MKGFSRLVLAVLGAATMALSAHYRALAAPAHQTPQSLALPSSAFAPATSVFNTALTNDQTNNITLKVHTRSYADLGRVSGWYQYYRVTAATGEDLQFIALASAYSSPEQARGAVADFTQYMQTLPANTVAPLTDCDAVGAVQPLCKYAWRLTNNGQTYNMTAIVQYNNCTDELNGEVPYNSNYQATTATIGTVVRHLEAAAEATLKSACGSSTRPPGAIVPTFHVDKVQIETRGDMGDGVVSPAPVMKRVRIKHTFYAVTYATFTNFTTAAPFQFRWTVMLGKKTVDSRSLDGAVNQYLTNGQRVRGYMPMQLSRAGTYKLIGSIIVNGETKQMTKTFKVTK